MCGVWLVWYCCSRLLASTDKLASGKLELLQFSASASAVVLPATDGRADDLQNLLVGFLPKLQKPAKELILQPQVARW